MAFAVLAVKNAYVLMEDLKPWRINQLFGERHE
jgi:hypothetical protein